MRHHPAPVFIIVCKAAHPGIAAVIHRCQFATRRPAIAHQQRGWQVFRVFRVVRQPHGRQTDAVIPAIFGVTRQGIRKSGLLRPAGSGLFSGLFCPLCLRGQYQPEVTPGTIRHAGDFAAEFSGGFAVERLCAPEAVHLPGQYPVRRQRRRQHLIRLRHPLTPTEQPPRPLRAVRRQITVRT